MNNTKHRYVFLAAAAALSLSLAACSDGGEGDGDANGSDDAGTSQDAGEGTDGGGSTDDGGAAEDGGSEDEGGAEGDGGGETGATGAADCLIGTWTITSESLEEQALAVAGGEGEVSVEGSATVTFDETTYTQEAHSSVEVSTESLQTSTENDGSYTMEYTADDTAVTFGAVVSASGTSTTSIGGQPIEASYEDVANLLVGQSQAYICSDSELTLTIAAEGFSVDMTYTRS